jgi:hypothetical protein
MNEREAFDTWYQTQETAPWYKGIELAIAWSAWQARAAVSAAPTLNDDLREALSEAITALEVVQDEGETSYQATVSQAIDSASKALERSEAAPTLMAEPVAWHVCSVNSDGSLSLEHACAWEEATHEHINDAINEHDIADAASWVVRPVYASPRPTQTEPTPASPQPAPKPLSERIAQLEAAEEGAKEAFGVVVEDKRTLEAENAQLLVSLHSAHEIIRRNAKVGAAMEALRELAESHKGRADDCGRLARAVLAAAQGEQK